MSDETPVIFRSDVDPKSPDFLPLCDVFAIFPEDLADYGGYDVTVYQYIGGHCAGTMSVIVSKSYLVRDPKDYAPLMEVLTQNYEYENLKVYQRETRGHREARMRAAKEMK